LESGSLGNLQLRRGGREKGNHNHTSSQPNRNPTQGNDWVHRQGVMEMKGFIPLVAVLCELKRSVVSSFKKQGSREWGVTHPQGINLQGPNFPTSFNECKSEANLLRHEGNSARRTNTLGPTARKAADIAKGKCRAVTAGS